MKKDFLQCLENKISFKGFGLPPEKISSAVSFVFDNQEYTLKNGSGTKILIRSFRYTLFLIDWFKL